MDEIARILYNIDDAQEQWVAMEDLLREAYEEGYDYAHYTYRGIEAPVKTFDEWMMSG